MYKRQILDTLEAMRLFLFNGNVSFVLGADERHVTYAIRSKFDDIEGINMDIGKEYQEKLIQYPIRIPSMHKDETEFYIMCLLAEEKLSKTEFEGLLKFLQTKRWENPLGFVLSMEVLRTHSDSIATRLNESLILSKQLSEILTQGLNGNPRQCKRFLNTLDMRKRMAKDKNVTLKSCLLYTSISALKDAASGFVTGISDTSPDSLVGIATFYGLSLIHI